MPLAVEDGTGVSGAEGYLTLDLLAAYLEARHGRQALIDGVQGEAAIRRGSAFVDGRYRSRWPGYRKKIRGQGLEWPRTGAFDADGYAIDPNTVPQEVVQAAAEAAMRELDKPGSLNPDVVPSKVKRRIKVGSIETEYAVGGSSVAASQPVVTRIDEVLAPILRPSRQAYTGLLARG